MKQGIDVELFYENILGAHASGNNTYELGPGVLDIVENMDTELRAEMKKRFGLLILQGLVN